MTCVSISLEGYFVPRRSILDVQFVVSEGQHADVLTKFLAAMPFQSHRRFLLNMPVQGAER